MAFIVQVNLKPKMRAELLNSQVKDAARWQRKPQKVKRRKGREALPPVK